MTSSFDSYRPPEPARKKRRRPGGEDVGRRRPAGQRGADGGREMPMVDDVEFTSYYGRSIVKAPPWGKEISIYLVLGGLAGGSGILACGAEATGISQLRRNSRFTALGAVGVGALALIADLGRPERFLNMMRTVKITSPMSLGTWILSGFGASAGLTAVIEADRILPLLRGPLKALRALEKPASLIGAVSGGLLATYTGVLLGGTAVPTWNAAGRAGMPVLFGASAAMATGGTAMVLNPVAVAGPARLFAIMGTGAEMITMRQMTQRMHPAEVEPMETGEAGRRMRIAEKLGLAGAATTVVLDAGARLAHRADHQRTRGGKRSRKLKVVHGVLRAGSILAGATLSAASAFTRFGMMEAGHASTRDPRAVVEPQRDRLEERRSQGIVDDSITTGPRPR